MVNICKLCAKNKELNESHIVPAFVGKWLKDTAPTGYLRQAVNANKRIQDIAKEPLLCNDCEQLFSKFEDKFAEKVFYPYVYKELDSWSVTQGKIKEIQYEDWLLKFIVSLQWRALVTDETRATDSDLKFFQKKIVKAEEIWRDYLLGLRSDSGESRHYVMFLQNLAAGRGYLPEEINPRVNTYLIRSVDTTCVVSKTKLFLYTKLGPIVVVSGIVPPTLNNMNDALVKMKGSLKIAQILRNVFVNYFIIVTRPNEAMNLIQLSDKQQNKINQDFLKNASNPKGANSVLVGYSDYMMSQGKRIKK